MKNLGSPIGPKNAVVGKIQLYILSRTNTVSYSRLNKIITIMTPEERQNGKIWLPKNTKTACQRDFCTYICGPNFGNYIVWNYKINFRWDLLDSNQHIDK